MVDQIDKFMNKLPPLKKETSPGVASVLGFLFGGIGLGLYFWSFVDFLIPIGLAILATVSLGLLDSNLGLAGILGGAIIAGLWGYFRSVNSNERLTRVKEAHVPLPE